jgi:flavorubredoxin
MKRMGELGEITTIGTGHGPLFQHNVVELTGRYRTWSQTKAKAETTVALFYVSDYGYSDRLAQSIASGITKTDVAVEMVDLRSADLQEVQELVSRCAGIVIGMPPTTAESTTAQTVLSTVLAAAKGKQVVGIFESGGGDDEPVDTLLSKFRDLGLKVAFPAIRLKQTPNEITYKLCEEAGTDLGQLLTRERNIKQIKSLDTNLELAWAGLAADCTLSPPRKVMLPVPCSPPGCLKLVSNRWE